jgi:hypothetical protein
MLNNEFKYFRKHQQELVSKYEGKYIVIVGHEVVGAYVSEGEAYANSIKNYKPGSFLIQHCISGKDAYSQTFHTRVAFN